MSVDIICMGIDKVYGMMWLVEFIEIVIDDMLFVGDRFDFDGNDYLVKVFGVLIYVVEGWEDMVVFVEQFLVGVVW